MNHRLFLSVFLISAASVWADAWHPVALQSEITHVQPMTGLVLWPDNDYMSSLQNSISLEFSYCLPCDVVVGKQDGKIVYDWTKFDQLLSGCAKRGHSAVIRFRYAYPSGEKINGVVGATAVPKYIKDMPGYSETYAKNPGGDGPTWYPDWSNAELQWFTRQFYSDLNARYASDPRLAFLEVGFGHWGEYHIYGSTTKFGVNFPTKQYQAEFFQHLDTALTIPWLVSIDAGDDSYSPLQTNTAMQACRFGLFDDSFMHSEHDFSQGDGWNERCWNWSDPAHNRWHTGVNGGEISYYTEDDQHNFLNPAGMYGVTWEQAAAKYHLTFINANDAPDGKYASAARVRQASMATGYRFAVIAAESDGQNTRLSVINEGVAPIYYDAWFAIGNVRSSQSLRGLIPGQTLVVTIPAVGTPSIVCDHLLPTQQIQYRANCFAPTSVNANMYEQNAIKTIRNGKIRITRNGITYDALGRVVQ